MSMQNGRPLDPNATPDVWPPPPNAGAAKMLYNRPYRLAPFQPLDRLKNEVIVALLVKTVWDLFIVRLPMSLMPIEAVAGSVSTVMPLVTAIIFLRWTYRAYANIRALGVEPPKITPGWAVGYFFFPFLNLYRPCMTLSEIWRRSDPEPMIEHGTSAGSPVVLWWITFLAANTIPLSFIVALSQAHGTILANVIDPATTIMSAGLAILVVKQISDRQTRRRQALEAAGML